MDWSRDTGAMNANNALLHTRCPSMLAFIHRPSHVRTSLRIDCCLRSLWQGHGRQWQQVCIGPSQRRQLLLRGSSRHRSDRSPKRSRKHLRPKLAHQTALPLCHHSEHLPTWTNNSLASPNIESYSRFFLFFAMGCTGLHTLIPSASLPPRARHLKVACPCMDMRTRIRKRERPVSRKRASGGGQRAGFSKDESLTWKSADRREQVSHHTSQVPARTC